MSTPLTTNLWFDGQAEEAARFYCSVFEDSEVTGVTPYPDGPMGEPGSAMVVEFTLRGMPFVGLNGGPQFPFTEAVSFVVSTADQAETDHYWTVLTADGGQESNCGWLKDRFGLSWQVVPRRLMELFRDGDAATAARVNEAMLAMHKIDIAELEAAASAQK